MMKTPKEHSTSVWMAPDRQPEWQQLRKNERAQVCIVGAGIAGLTTAYLLIKAGKSVIVLDDGSIGSGETQRTTAHLSFVLDDRYFHLAELHGGDGARLAAESHAAAIDTIERIIHEEDIDCDFERVDGYLFNAPDQLDEVLDRELAAAGNAGITDADFVDRAPLTCFDTGRALRFGEQAQFHPLKYLAALAERIGHYGGRIFTGTHASEFDGGSPARVETRCGHTVSCDEIVVATNTPVNDMLVIHTKQAAYRSYVIGVAVPVGSVPKALYWDTGDPYHYVRIVAAATENPAPAQDLLIVGGEDHKTGQADDSDARYTRLEQWTRERFPMATEVEFRWSGQVMEPVDGLAFIGRNPLDQGNIYIATGDSGNGMTHGTIAGLLLTDLITGRENPWADLYSPSRVSLAATAKFAKETANVAAQYVDWLTPGDANNADLVSPGNGAIVRHGIAKIAVCREANGRLHEHSAVCPHLGAILTWNHGEKTWDCPAHGSRFDCRGGVLNGPANKDLEAITAKK